MRRRALLQDLIRRHDLLGLHLRLDFSGQRAVLLDERFDESVNTAALNFRAEGGDLAGHADGLDLAVAHVYARLA